MLCAQLRGDGKLALLVALGSGGVAALGSSGELLWQTQLDVKVAAAAFEIACPCTLEGEALFDALDTQCEGKLDKDDFHDVKFKNKIDMTKHKPVVKKKW